MNIGRRQKSLTQRHKSKPSYWPHFSHGVTGGRGFCGLPLHTRVGVDPVFSTFALGVQGDVWRCVTDLHSCLWRGHHHGRRRRRGLHRHHGRHRSGLPGDGAVRRLTAVVRRGVHGRVDRLPGRRLRGQGAHGGVDVPVGLLGGGGKPTLPPWYPAELPGDEEGDAKQSQATGRHHQWQEAHWDIWEGDKTDRK